jgi:hypothetical protein
MLAMLDPVFAIDTRSLMVLVAAVEVGVVLIVRTQWERLLGPWTLVWFAGCALLYRGAAAVLDTAIPCPCFGSLGDWTGLSRDTLSAMGICVLLYCLTGAISALYLQGVVDLKQYRYGQSHKRAVDNP